MVARSHQRAESMLELISELLDLAHHRNAKPEEEAEEPAELEAVVRETVELHRATAEEKNMKLEWRAEAPGAKVPAGAAAVRDVVSNLVSNAVKYTPEGGKVSVRTWIDDDRVWFEVQDTGIGIPKEEQYQLFHEFFRATNAKEVQVHGTGLGLVIAREVVTKHGGDMEFESEEGVGTTFRFFMPLASPAQTETAT